MPSPAKFATDALKLLWLILLLPLFLLLIGPALIAAAVRGTLPLPGGITLRPGKRRIQAFFLGLIVLLAVWGALGWALLSVGRTSQSSKLMLVPPTSAPTSTAIASTATPVPATVTSTPTPTAPLSPAPTVSPANTPKPTATGTPIPPTAATLPPTATPASAPLNTAGALQAVQAANILLRQAIVSPDEEHLTALAAAWNGEALAHVQQFAVEMNRKYALPLNVSYELLGEMTVQPNGNNQSAIVSSTELWRFQGKAGERMAATVYHYTLNPLDGQWKITAFSFTVLPTPTPVAVTP